MPLTLADCSASTNKKTEKCAFKYSAVINSLRDVISDVVDGMPAHCSRQTIVFLHLHVSEFVEAENWLTNSPDLNPVDCVIWGAFQQLVCRHHRI